MIRLSRTRDTEIRNRLDEIQARMYHNATLFDDVYWSHETIKELLLDIYFLQLNGEEEKNARGQPKDS